MSIKLLLNTLRSLGLKPSEAKIYVYLAKKGPLRAHDIYGELKLTKQQLYPCLENLKKKGIIYSTLERPALFYAMPFEKVLYVHCFENGGGRKKAGAQGGNPSDLEIYVFRWVRRYIKLIDNLGYIEKLRLIIGFWVPFLSETEESQLFI